MLPTDEAVEAAKASVVTWLALVDGGEVGESWEVAGSLFKSGVSREKWVGMLKQARGPLGGVRSRELSSSKFSTELPSAPEGEYVVLEYATSFENRKGATERLVVMLDKDGEYRVIGYGIQSRAESWLPRGNTESSSRVSLSGPDVE